MTRSFSIGRGWWRSWKTAFEQTTRLRMSVKQTAGTMATKSSYSSSTPFGRFCCYGKTGLMLLVVLAALWMLLLFRRMTWETNGMGGGGTYVEAPGCVQELIRKDRPMTIHRMVARHNSLPAEDAVAAAGGGDDQGTKAAMLIVQYYYLVTPPCCDRFTTLYDAVTCQRVCSPSGGLKGTGDGKCPPDVYDNTDTVNDGVVLIWKRKKSG
jgi:hypothetical protein